MSKVILVHGFNVKDNGKGTTGKLAQRLPLEGKPCQFRYGWKGLLGVRLFNGLLARLLSDMTSDGAVGIGHSNGCAILHRAAAAGAPFRHLILINPALDNDAEFAPGIERIDVLYNPTDPWVAAARWLPHHPWGDMGRHGYSGHDPRVRNFDTQALLGAAGHSGVFDETHVDALATFVNTLIKG